MSIIDGDELDELRDKAAQCEAFRAKLSESLGREMVLRAALKECSDDLAAEIEARFDAVKRHPAMAANYERDMAPVKNARQLLAGEQKANNK